MVSEKRFFLRESLSLLSSLTRICRKNKLSLFLFFEYLPEKEAYLLEETYKYCWLDKLNTLWCQLWKWKLCYNCSCHQWGCAAWPPWHLWQELFFLVLSSAFSSSGWSSSFSGQCHLHFSMPLPMPQFHWKLLANWAPGHSGPSLSGLGPNCPGPYFTP